MTSNSRGGGRQVFLLLVAVGVGGLAGAALFALAFGGLDGFQTVQEPPRVQEPLAGPRPEIPPAAARRPDGPNVVWILLDACRARNLSCMGYERKTSPVIDGLAARGVVFENHFAQGIYTEVSVPSYITGRYYPLASLDVQRVYPPREQPAGEVAFPVMMVENGYRTACFTSHGMMTPTSPFARAFPEFHLITPEAGVREPYVTLEAMNEQVLPWLESAADAPFFLYVHSLDTHFPHALEAPHDQWLPEPRATAQIVADQPTKAFGNRFDAHEMELLRGLHDGAIHYVDAHVGAIVAKLGELGLLEQTIVVIASDHGDALGEDGVHWGHWHSFDEVMQVPFILAGPGIPEGRRVSSLTENVDIVPTLMDLLGLETPAAPDGRSLRPLMENPDGPPLRDYVISRYFHHEYDGGQRFVMRGLDYKLEWDKGRDRMHLYPVPDTVAGRRDVIGEKPEVARAMHDRFMTEVWPLWEAYRGLEPSWIDIPMTRELLLNEGRNEGIVVFGETDEDFAASHDDGKWFFRDGVVWNSGWAERVPPLALSITVPPGRYEVLVYALTATEFDGYPASSHLVIAEDDLYAHRVTWNPPDKEAVGFEHRYLRTYTIEDGRFDVVLQDDHPAYWGAIRHFRFVPARDEADGASGMTEDYEELLRGLGYVE